MASATAARMDSASRRLVEARAVRPSITGRMLRCVLRSATFWGISLLANRVSACESGVTMASISVTPWARAASSTCWKTSSGIGGPDLDLAKTRRARAVAGAHHLLGLPLAAVGNTPQGPMPAVRDGDALVPELGGDAAVAGILQHAHAAAVVDLPGDFAAELEVVALVVYRPAPVCLHVDAIGVEDVVEREVAGLETHVGHADERNSRPAIGAHAAVGAGFAHRSRGLAQRHVAGELAAADDIGALRGNAFVVEGEGAEAGAVIEARVAHP